MQLCQSDMRGMESLSKSLYIEFAIARNEVTSINSPIVSTAEKAVSCLNLSKGRL